jgi:hypothetical protein
MNRPPRRLLVLVVTVLVATGVTVAAYLHGQAEVERLRQGTALEPVIVPEAEVSAPADSIQVRADVPDVGERRAS